MAFRGHTDSLPPSRITLRWHRVSSAHSYHMGGYSTDTETLYTLLVAADHEAPFSSYTAIVDSPPGILLQSLDPVKACLRVLRLPMVMSNCTCSSEAIHSPVHVSTELHFRPIMDRLLLSFRFPVLRRSRGVSQYQELKDGSC